MKGEVFSLKKHVEKLLEKTKENENQDTAILLFSLDQRFLFFPILIFFFEIVANLIDRHFRIKVSPSDISTFHRLNTRKSVQQKDLIVKFFRRNIKTDILERCRTSKPENFLVNECLTPARQTISYVLGNQNVNLAILCPALLLLKERFLSHGWNFQTLQVPMLEVQDLKIVVNIYVQLVEFCEKNL